MDNFNIGKNILKRRKELNLTQEELATLMGYKSKTSINKIEKGFNDIPQSKIMKFAEALRTTPSYLMGWQEPDYIVKAPSGEEILVERYRELDEENAEKLQAYASILLELQEAEKRKKDS